MVTLPILIVSVIILLFCSFYYIDTRDHFTESSHEWQEILGRKLKQASISADKVCGVDKEDNIFCSKVGSKEWKQKEGKLKHVSLSGQKICGVNSDNDIFCADDVDHIQWKKIDGKLTQIDVSGHKMCGVNGNYEIFCADYGKSSWQRLPGLLKHVSIDGVKMCGANMVDDVFCADSLVDPQWKQIRGSLKQIDTSDGKMCGVNSKNEVWCADYGRDNWEQKPGTVKFVSIDNNRAYGIGENDNVNYSYNVEQMKRTIPEEVSSTKEDNPNLLNKQSYSDFLAHENSTCKFVKDILKGEEINYDIIKNMVLVNDPTTPNQCYIKDLSSVVDGECTKDNRDLYDPEAHSSLIEDIQPNLVQDSYVSTSLPQNACVIKFSKTNNDPSQLKSYLSMIDNNLPKQKRIRQNLKEAREFSDVLKEEIKQGEKEIVRLQSILAEKDNIIKDQTNVLKNLDTVSRQNKISEQNSQIKSVEDQYEQRSKLEIQACKDYSFNECQRLPIGRYNIHQMESMGVQNDSISSIKVPQGLIARFYSDTLDVNGNTNGNNKYLEVDGRDIPDVTNEKWADGTNHPNLNDSISSITVQAKSLDPNVPILWTA